mgnify:CR=1 FL=1
MKPVCTRRQFTNIVILMAYRTNPIWNAKQLSKPFACRHIIPNILSTRITAYILTTHIIPYILSTRIIPYILSTHIIPYILSSRIIPYILSKHLILFLKFVQKFGQLNWFIPVITFTLVVATWKLASAIINWTNAFTHNKFENQRVQKST